eukprot:TRINITY_DN3058_c0_g3_i2.p1 TRINITY_DN3058_c0_g3~~TRINITY_DN3058_c0_g3_i2.p1  ORF type:complete len:419 (+),score=91.59 TRINITY_DN3058_c0_g3_i2:90-1346(+)
MEPTLTESASMDPMLPLYPAINIEVGWKVQCIWRDGSIRTAEVIEKRELKQGSPEYYVHYTDFDKRLDEWVTQDRLQLDISLLPATSPPLLAPPLLNRKRSKRKIDEVVAETTPEAAFEKEHEEITKVRNVDVIQIGKYEVDTWYYSPYPDEYSKLRKLYICEFCLKYMKSARTLLRHKAECDLHHPPGNEIYRHESLSVFEVDGKKNKVYCQNLCLLSKLFLDHKTLYYDVEPFWFYILCESDHLGFHVVGYFSKEKSSPEDYNLACILVFPQYQRRGYGKFLISLSYELSRREERPGTPEKPLSDLGKVSYRSYWTEILLDVLKHHGRDLQIKDLVNLTYIKAEDIVTTLQALSLVKYWKGQHIISYTPKALEHHIDQLKTRGPGRYTIFDPARLMWRPHFRQISTKPEKYKVRSF